MPNPVWPTTLPVINYPSPDSGYSYAPQNQALRTQMDAGPKKSRRRFSAGYTAMSINIDMTGAQVAILKTFYYTTLAVVLPFDWIDHTTRTTATYVFLEPPGYSPLAADWWRVSLQLEQQP